MQSRLNNRVLNATKWSAISEITAKLAAPITNIILARLLTPAEFGVIASITIITSFADIFTDAGFQKFVIQREFQSENELNNYSDVAFTSNAILSTLIYLIIFGFRSNLAKAIGCPEASNGLAVAALTVLCTAFSSIVVARFRRNLEFKPLFYIRLGSALIPLLVTVPLAILMRNYWAIVFGTVAQQLFIAVIATCISKYKPKVKMHFELLHNMLSFSLWNLCETLSIWFAGQANIFIVASALNSYYLGLYKTGMSTINSYMSIVTAAVTPVLFSALSRAQNDDVGFKALLARFQRIISILVFPMGLGLLVYRKLAVIVLLGSQWLEIADFVGLWALASAFTITFSNTACEVYRSKGKPKISFILQMIYLVIYVPAIFVSAKISFTCLCVTSCMIRFVPIIMDFLTLKYKFGFELKKIFNNTIIQLVAAVIMAVAGYFMQVLSASIIWHFISVIVCMVIYFAFLAAFPTMRAEIKNIKKLRN